MNEKESTHSSNELVVPSKQSTKTLGRRRAFLSSSTSSSPFAPFVRPAATCAYVLVDAVGPCMVVCFRVVYWAVRREE